VPIAVLQRYGIPILKEHEKLLIDGIDFFIQTLENKTFKVTGAVLLSTRTTLFVTVCQKF
jgi:hypothetical protein